MNIYEAVKTISNCCKKNSCTCVDCELWDREIKDCSINMSNVLPEDWKIPTLVGNPIPNEEPAPAECSRRITIKADTVFINF